MISGKMLLTALVLATLLVLVGPRMMSQAQEQDPADEQPETAGETSDLETAAVDTEWSTPLNLSLSGTADDPRAVVDANQQVHLFWRDNLDGVVYSRGNGTDWTAPAVVEVPFGTTLYFPDFKEGDPLPVFTPTLAGDRTNRLHAFWIDEENRLFQSRVDAEQVVDFEAWARRETVAEAALKVAVVVDDAGTLHLVYLRPLDTESAPSGIYYRYLSESGGDWSEPRLLYASRYFRSLSPAQSSLRIVANQTAGANQLYVTWDNQPLGQAFLARTADGGQNWDEPVVIDARESGDAIEAVGPTDVAVGVDGETVVTIWRAGHGEFTCAQYYRWSADGGTTWGERELFNKVRGCPEQNDFLKDHNDNLILLSNIQGLAHFVAWKEMKWSEARPQEILASFTNPQTNQLVEFGCQQPLWLGEQLLVAGCDEGETNDIWLTSRRLGPVAEWFPSPSAWQSPQQISQGDSPWSLLELLTDDNGRYHLFWGNETEESIYYSRWDGAHWSQPLAALQSPDGRSSQAAVTSRAGARLLAVWRAGPGDLYFSQVTMEEAVNASKWSTPQQLPARQTGAATPVIAVDNQGTIYIAYSLPLNEERGIYLIHSGDGGETWSDPALVFDGAAAGWPMVGAPSLSVSRNGELHLIWTKQTLPGDSTVSSQALYHAYSADGGASFADPRLIVEAPVLWSRIIATGEQTVHRIWQELEGNNTVFWHEQSYDGGRNWQAPIRISNFSGPVTLVPDRAGRLHLMQIVGKTLQQWLWDGSRWTAQETLDVDPVVEAQLAAVTVREDNTLAVVYGGRSRVIDNPQQLLYFSRRTLDLPPAPIIPTAPATTTPLPSPTLTAAPALTSTPETPTFAITPDSESDRAPAPENNWQRLAIGIVPVSMLVVVVVVLGLRTAGRKRR